MKTTNVTSMGASLLLIALIGQVGSFKLTKQTATVAQPTVQQQEEAIHREQLQQQRQFELLQQQQHQAEYQIQQQQLEAERFLKQHQARQEFSSGGVKGAPLAPPVAAPFRPAEAYERPLYAQGPRQPTIAYLLVRPPYPAPLPYDESAYRGYLPPLTRPQAYPEYPRQTIESYGTKGGRQEVVAAPLPQPPPPPPAPLQAPVEQPAIVVPVNGDKQGKFKAMIDKLMSKLSFSSYEVAGEEYLYPAPSAGPIKQEAPIVQQQQPIVQQHEANIEQQQFREEDQQQQSNFAQQQQQQQQVAVEPERDQGFDEAVKAAPAPTVQKPLEQTKQEVKEELVQQQLQQVQEQDFSRQPLAPAKGGQQPVRQPEPIQQQRQEDAIKASRKYVQQQQQQQQYLQQEPIRQEQKGGF